MKAVIPVAGAGTQLRPHTHTQPKPLIPVAGKPILGHIIDNLIEAGIRKQIFIVGYLKEKISTYVEEQYGDQIEAEFVVQEPRKGLAHAIWTAQDHFREEEEILIVLGDTIFTEDTKKLLKLPGSILAVHQVDDPRSFGIAMLDEHKMVKKLVEKPEIPTSNLALVGMYKICHIPELIHQLNTIVKPPLDPGKEYYLTDVLMGMVNAGVELRTHTVENWYDCGKKQTLLLTNRILLERLNNLSQYQLENTVVIPPVHIAEGCDIQGSIIGPYVAIAENAKIHHSIVSDSILGAYSQLESIILSHSVIGNDTSLKGKSNSINIGDNTEIDFDQ
ncbi:MAG: sugar phosphate nucleotidyltransferase [Bacteroidota bacterium]